MRTYPSTLMQILAGYTKVLNERFEDGLISEEKRLRCQEKLREWREKAYAR